ncbi:protein lifeguard 1-like [Sphaerodactylus townsendi]|uniref:protein lifeguard 1-like n=1 Tax=Sphaerodactylus townsendi TaxID=933632 RepID=UPI002026F23D|nr:protein lifeguard 1-like [Sphaerodactylus townsendi]
MESNLLASFQENIGPVLYIEYQDPGGEAPLESLPDEHSENKPPQEDTLPTNNQANADELPPQVYREGSKKHLKVSHSRSKHLGRWSRRRAQQLASLGEDEGPFAERSIRRGFIRKIYLILSVQLGITLGIICLFIYWRFLKIWVRRRPWFCYSLLPVILILAITLACCDDARRTAPLNYILLLIFTFVEGMLLGSLAGFFDANGIMWAVGGTAFVTLGLSLFALQTKWDLTITSGVLLAMFFVFIAFGILCGIIRSQLMSLLYAAIGALLFAIYLVVDTQLMLGRNHHYRLNPEEYIFAVLNVYIDIINMCLFILQFVGFVK